MKPVHLLLISAMVGALAACEQKPSTSIDQLKDKVNDALDRRPNEKLRDAAEDIRDGIKDAAKDIKDAAKGAGSK